MNLEIIYGGKTYYVSDCGNQYRGCMEVLKRVADNEVPPISDFDVYNIGTGEQEMIELDLVLALQHISNNYEEYDYELPMRKEGLLC